jgi:peptidyl-prolyl cis-trans isomerase A (cyclophilin A)
MYYASRWVTVACLAAAAWGCKKQSTSPGPVEADDAEIAEPATTAEGDGQPEASPGDTPAESAPDEPAPAQEASAGESENTFAVKLDTTKGEIIIDVHPDWAPLGAERFRELVAAGFYNDVAFFRVMEGFMAQAGISGKPALNKKWGNKPIKDEPARAHNTRGMVTFAMAGPNSRTTQFFINFVDNTQLDAMGFAPFGEVRDMTVADAIYAGYGDGPPSGKGPNQQRIKQQGNKYLKKKFPELDYIRSATLIEE